MRGHVPRGRGDRADLGRRPAWGSTSSKAELGTALRRSPSPARLRALPDGDRPVVHGGRPRDGRHGDGGVGERVRRRRARVAAGRPGRAGARACTATTGPVERIGRGSRAAINLVGVHHGEIGAGQELAAPGYLPGDARPLGGRSRARPRPSGRSGTGAATRCTWGPPRSRRPWPCWKATSSHRRAHRLGQLFLAEPVVAVHGQPFVLREESPPATLGGGRVLQPLRAGDSAGEISARSSGSAGCDRPTRSSVCPRPWRSWASPWTERGPSARDRAAARSGRQPALDH